jgi:hypothetical protein
VVDVGFGAGKLERMSRKRLSLLRGQFDLGGHGDSVAGRSEVHSVVSKHGMDLVGHNLDEGLEKVREDPCRGPLLQLDEDEPRGSIDSDEEIEFALPGTHLHDINMEVADRIGLELLPLGLVTLDIGQARNAMPLKTTVQRRSATSVQSADP